MRRNDRNGGKKQKVKSILYLSGAFLAIAVIAFIVTFVVYTNKLNNASNKFSAEKIAELVPNETQAQEANSKMGRTVEESESLLESNVVENNKILLEEKNNTVTNNVVGETVNQKTTKTNANTVKAEKKDEKKSVADPEFIKPVEGEISKKFARENLIYSETLKEWITHDGIDIIATKASMVKASAEGTVTAIKNDPRYGITVIIEHANGFETRYSNLLTSEFVVEGEKVDQGQSIGTVGNTAMFEVADESHLHFELLKDSEALDPELYLK